MIWVFPFIWVVYCEYGPLLFFRYRVKVVYGVRLKVSRQFMVYEVLVKVMAP